MTTLELNDAHRTPTDVDIQLAADGRSTGVAKGAPDAYHSSTGGYTPCPLAMLPSGMCTSPNFLASAAAFKFQTP